MMKCRCPLQDEINNFLESIDWTNYLSTEAREAVKFLLRVDHLHYSNLDLGRLNPTLYIRHVYVKCPHWPNQLQLP